MNSEFRHCERRMAEAISLNNETATFRKNEIRSDDFFEFT